MDREDGVHRHRHAGIDIALAKTLEVHRLAAALDQHDGAGNFSDGDFAIEEVVDPLELLDRQLGAWRRTERDRGGGQRDHGRGDGSDHPGERDSWGSEMTSESREDMH